MNSGVYQITFDNSDKRYIGSAVDISRRKRAHQSYLNRGQHPNRHLQNAFNKYGAKSFHFEILLYCDPENCLLYEQSALDYYAPERLYNKRAIAKSNLGIRYSDEVKRKASEAAKRKSEEMGARAKIYWEQKRAAGSTSFTEEHKEHLRHPNSKPKTFTPESRALQRKRLSIATKAYWERRHSFERGEI